MKSFLNYFNLSDEYERKARFFPAVLSVALFLPGAISLGLPMMNWVLLLLTGTGISAVVAVGLSHLASAMGNRLQDKMWPRWPHDSPTHRRLYPNDPSCSRQQREQWYMLIKDLTSLDIAAVAKENRAETETIINDAINQIRIRLWKSPLAERLRIHNMDSLLSKIKSFLDTIFKFLKVFHRL